MAVWTRLRIAREELRFLSARKVYNLAMEAIAPRLRWVRLPYRPTKITVESGNVCNLRCPLCPTGQGDSSAQKGMLPYATFEKILDQLGKDLITLRLYNWGEPLLNKHIVKMCELAYARRVSVKLSSHLNDLTPELAEGLLRAKVKKIYISADGATPESYAIYRRGGDWKVVMDNIRMLVAKKREMNAVLHARHLALPRVPPQRARGADRERLAAELGVELQLNKARTDMGREIFETAEQALERDGHWLPESQRVSRLRPRAEDARSARPCARCRGRTRRSTGTARCSPAAASTARSTTTARSTSSDFGEIWNGEMYTEARREIVGQSPTKDTICKTCKHNGYLFL